MNHIDITEQTVRDAIALIAAAGNEDVLGGNLILADIFAQPLAAHRTLIMLAAMCAELLSTMCTASGQDPNVLLHMYALQLAEENK